MSVIPYRLKLKKVSGERQRLLEALYSYLPNTGMRDKFTQGIHDEITRHVSEGFAMKLEAVEQKPYFSFLERIPAQPLLVVIGLLPYESKIVCEIDSTLAMMAVERMLGGFVESMPEPRGLSETEQGVLEYLILQVLAHIHAACGMDQRVHFCFDRFATHVDQVRHLAGPQEEASSLAFRVTLGKYAGFVRLIFPDPFVEEALLNTESLDLPRPEEQKHVLAKMQQLEYVEVPLWAEAGRTTLVPADLLQIEEGDIILFEHGDIALAGDEKSGKVIVRIGKGIHGGYDAHLSLDARRAHVTIEGIHKGA